MTILRRDLLQAIAALPEPGRISGQGPAQVRSLLSFQNADGRIPDGKETPHDDSVALNRALAAGPGLVYIPPGFYRASAIRIPPGVSLAGAGIATVLRSHGAGPVFTIAASEGWSLSDLVVDGEAQGSWKNRTDAGRHGIVVEGCAGYEIERVTVRNWDGAGIHLTRTGKNSYWTNGGRLTAVVADGNFFGIRFDSNAEYITASEISCLRNVTGCIIHSGNCKLTGSNLGGNIDGLVIEDKSNGSHGVISGCLINHNERYALLCRNVKYGMSVDACCFFYGAIRLENSVGVNITSGTISCSVSTVGEPASRIAGNFIIPEGWQFEFAPSTLVRDNFLKEGNWPLNKA